MLRIAALEAHPLAIPQKAAFGHASHVRSVAEPILVEARGAGGGVGWGEIQPRAYVTGETHASVLGQGLPAARARWVGFEATDFDAVLAALRAALDAAGRALACAGGVELAILDLAGRHFGVPLARVLGEVEGPALPQGIILGFEVETAALAKRCAFLRLGGRRHVKVKIGRADDAERLAIVARALPGVPLRLDANEAYAPDVLVALLRGLDPSIGIASVEQPVPAADHAGLAAVRRAARVMVDESLVSLDDLRALLAADAVDVLNLRVGKCGGLLGTRRLADAGRAAGLELHLGTMVGETGVLTRATELVARFVPGLACVDGKGQNQFLLAEDVLDDPKSAESAPLDRPGLGVDVDPARVARLRAPDGATPG